MHGKLISGYTSEGMHLPSAILKSQEFLGQGWVLIAVLLSAIQATTAEVSSHTSHVMCRRHHLVVLLFKMIIIIFPHFLP